MPDGRTLVYRILPETSAGGLLVGGLPTSLAQLQQLVEGTVPPSAIQMRVVGPGKQFYQRDVKVTWIELDVATATDATSR